MTNSLFPIRAVATDRDAVRAMEQALINSQLPDVKGFDLNETFVVWKGKLGEKATIFVAQAIALSDIYTRGDVDPNDLYWRVRVWADFHNPGQYEYGGVIYNILENGDYTATKEGRVIESRIST